MPLPTGARLGPYEVIAALGAGGMGEVYRARDTKLNRDVAIKVLLPAVANDPDRLARFSREAQVLASLNHPNIAAIYGLEDTGNVRALVMELVEGPTLADRLARSEDRALQLSAVGAAPSGRPIPIEEALPVAKQIAEALEAAHEQGIIHRDLKPANVKVRPDGTVKVLDFGLAKAMEPTGASSANAMNSPTISMHATQAGIILGTAAYMSPEQAKGRPVDKRADVWAFGCVLYEMLTAKRAFDGEDITDTIVALMSKEPLWAALPAGTSPRLHALLRDCLVRDPKQRLRDIGEARRVLDQVISGAPDSGVTPPAQAVAVRPETPAWRRVAPWAIAAIAVFVAGAATWNARSSPVAPGRSVSRSKVTLKDLSGFVDLSRDGTKLAYAVSSGTGFALVLRQMDQFEGKLLPGSDGGLYPTFSPAADWIAFVTVDLKIKKMPIAGGTSITLCDGNFANGAAWGDDDTIVFSGPKGLMRVSANGGAPQPLTTVDSAKGESRHTRPQFLPGGRQLLFTVISNSQDGAQFAVLDLQKGGYRIVAKSGDNGRYVPSGHLTMVRGGTLFAAPFDLARLTVTGTEVPVVEGVSTTGPAGTGDYAFSETGTLVYFESQSQGGTVLIWMDRKGVVQALPGQVPRQWGTGRLSPDGHRVANGIIGEKNTDIWVVDLARGSPTRLTFGGQNDNPSWTPDGRRIVYGGAKDGKFGLSWVPADGSGQPEIVVATDSAAVPTSFTPDGKTLLYTQTVAGRSRVLVLPLTEAVASRQPHPLREGAGADSGAQVSPDGKWVALMSTESGRPEVYVLPFPGPGPKTQVSTSGGYRPRWARSGREIFYWTPTAGNSALMSVAIQTTPFSAGEPREVFKAFSGTTWDVAPDGDHFLVEAVGTPGTSSAFATVTDWFDELRRRAPAKK